MAWHRRILDLLSVRLIFLVGGLYSQQAPGRLVVPVTI